MLKGAIVGFGEVARNGHWPAWCANADAEIVAVVDRSAARRDLAASLKPGLQTFESLDALAASTSIDFVDVCTPPAFHPQPILDALAHRWHVLCEKPLLLNLALVSRVRRLAMESGCAVVPVHNWKYAGIIQAATAALRAGAIGRLTRVEIETSRTTAAVTADGTGLNWRRDPTIAGGGILMDHGWHSTYLALGWFSEHVSAVRASVHYPSSAVPSPGPGGRPEPVEDEALMTLEFASGTAVINLTWKGAVRRNRIVLSGSAGAIVLDDDTLRVTGPNPQSTQFPSALSAGSHHADWYTAMMPDVVDCFRTPDLSRPLFDEAEECLSIIQLAYRGSRAPA